MKDKFKPMRFSEFFIYFKEKRERIIEGIPIKMKRELFKLKYVRNPTFQCLFWTKEYTLKNPFEQSENNLY